MSKRRASKAGQIEALKDGISAALKERRAAIRTGARVGGPTVKAIDRELKMLREALAAKTKRR